MGLWTWVFWELNVISSSATSTIEISAVHSVHCLTFRPLANSTAPNSTYLIRFKVIHFLQDVRKQLKQLKNQLNVINRTFLRNLKGHIRQTTICTKLQNDVSELHHKEIRCTWQLTRTTNLKRF